MEKEDLERLEVKIDELNQRIQLMEERQNSQYTDIMMQFKERTSDEGMIDCRSDEEIYEEVKEEIIELGKVSTSYIQRSQRIGYARAAKLMGLLEQRGVISKEHGAKPREVLIKPE